MLNDRKQASNLLEEGTRPEWLGEHRARHIQLSGNAGHEQHGRWTLEAGKAGGEFQAIHDGQEDIGDDKAEAPFQRAGNGQGLFPVLRREDSVTLISQRFRQDTAEHCVVLHDQHRLLTRPDGTHDIFGSGRENRTCPISWTARTYRLYSRDVKAFPGRSIAAAGGLVVTMTPTEHHAKKAS